MYSETIDLQQVRLNLDDYIMQKTYEDHIKRAEESLRFRLDLGVKAV